MEWTFGTEPRAPEDALTRGCSPRWGSASARTLWHVIRDPLA